MSGSPSRGWSIGAIVVSLACVTASTSAQDSAGAMQRSGAAEPQQPENLDATREARQFFSSGLEHFRAHRYREAIRDFQLALDRVPSADLRFNLARAHEELGEFDAAVANYRRYLTDRVDPPDRAQVEARIASLEERAEAARAARRSIPTHGTLTLGVNVEGAAVLVDGTPRTETVLELPPGVHRIEVNHPRYIPFRSEVQVRAGVRTAAYADMVPATEYRATRGDRLWTWVVGGVSVASLAASIGLGVAASSLDATRLDGTADREDARDFARASDAALGIAAVSGIAATILYFVEGRAIRTERVTAPQPERGVVRADSRPVPNAF